MRFSPLLHQPNLYELEKKSSLLNSLSEVGSSFLSLLHPHLDLWSKPAELLVVDNKGKRERTMDPADINREKEGRNFFGAPSKMAFGHRKGARYLRRGAL